MTRRPNLLDMPNELAWKEGEAQPYYVKEIEDPEYFAELVIAYPTMIRINGKVVKALIWYP